MLWFSCILALGGAAWGEAGVSPSSAPVRAPLPRVNPYELTFLYDDAGYRVRLDYRLRWDLDDAFRFPLSLGRRVLRPFSTVTETARDITMGARVGVYGLSIRPSRVVIESGGAVVSGPPGSGPGAATGPASRRRYRFSLNPLIDDLKRDLVRDLRKELLKQGFDHALPAGKDATYDQKRAVFDGILTIREQHLETFEERVPLFEPLDTLEERLPRAD